MIEIIKSVKAQAEKDLIFAQAKIDVANEILAKAEETQIANDIMPEDEIVADDVVAEINTI